MLASPQRPAGERQSKSHSPRRPSPVPDSSARGRPHASAKWKKPHHAKEAQSSAAHVQGGRILNKSVERLRNVGFPRSEGWDFGPSIQGGTGVHTERRSVSSVLRSTASSLRPRFFENSRQDVLDLHTLETFAVVFTWQLASCFPTNARQQLVPCPIVAFSLYAQPS